MKLPKHIMKLKTEEACLKAIDTCHANNKRLGLEAEKADKEWRDLAKRIDADRPVFGASAETWAAFCESKDLCDAIHKTANKLFKRAEGQLKKSKKISHRLAELRTIPIPEVERALTL